MLQYYVIILLQYYVIILCYNIMLQYYVKILSYNIMLQYDDETKLWLKSEEGNRDFKWSPTYIYRDISQSTRRLQEN